jgi:CRISPR type I-E-associated protein CasB/Cse2
VVEAAFVEPYHRLRRMMGNPNGEMELKRLGLIAVVLAHVDRDAPNDKSFAETMADGAKPIVSDVRFRQILRYRSQETDELLRDLVRVLRQVRGNAPIEKLAKDLWWWSDQTRLRWALEYYDKAKPEQDAQP